MNWYKPAASTRTLIAGARRASAHLRQDFGGQAYARFVFLLSNSKL
ncbi:hypothetical protein [Fodinibius halophilus]|nr:hypothetical protein [Fodinibius halophilus]